MIGRLHYLNHEYHWTIATNIALDELKNFLQPHADAFVYFNNYSEYGFSIAAMIEDIENLQKHGWEHLDPWWEQYDAHSKDATPTPEQKIGLIDEFWRRSQQVYKEIIGANFANFSTHMNFYCGMPMRYEVVIYSDRIQRPSMYYLYRPVKNWSEAGAGVTINDKDSSIELNKPAGHYQEVMDTLAQLGRVGCTSIRIRNGPPPLFDGDRHYSNFDGETAVLREAMEMLVSDLNKLFERGSIEKLRTREIVDF